MPPIWVHIVKTSGDMIDLYLTLLIFAIDKPTKQFIPQFYKSSSEEIRKQFVSSIEYRLRNMDTETKFFRSSYR